MNEELSLFYEDATEQLQIMESALLDAKDGTNDVEKIGEIFRAMHTIKGTAGMFEFDSIVSFTHVAENILDDVRSGNIELDSDLSALFMNVKDNTQDMVEFCVNGMCFTKEIIENTEKLKNSLSKFLPNSKEKFLETNILDEDIWQISLGFNREFFSSGMDIISIFRFFNKLGKIISITPIVDEIPNLEKINCLETYIGFEFEFQSSCSYEEILEIFEFVEDDIQLNVFKKEKKDSLPEVIVIEELTKENLEEVVKKEIEPVKDNTSSSSLRVDSSKVDLLINKMGEMVIQNAKLMQIAEQKNDDELEEVSAGISLLLEEIREAIMNIRMVQVQDSFVKFKRIVSDTAKKLGKDIDFIIEGGETELDKSVVEKLSDPLVHMLRNSIDHGIEMPDVRLSKGKDKKGRVYLRAYPDSGSIIIEIEDDGAGINKSVLLKKAIEKSLINKDDILTDKEIYKLIFHAGLSTASSVSDISGRGVGMDVVKRNIENLRGSIDIDSKENRGSKITIRLPLTLAIIDGFLVQAGETKYIIPLDLISECLELRDINKNAKNDTNTINVRGEILPLLDIISFFNEKRIDLIRKNVVVVKYGNYKVGLQVDELFGEQQTVIKSLGDIFKNVPGISGGSILGTGEVALIFDIARLLEYRINQGV